MKCFLFLLAVTTAASAFAYECEVDLMDQPTGYIYTRFVEDDDVRCTAAIRACQDTSVYNRLYNTVCLVMDDREEPEYWPEYRPESQPQYRYHPPQTHSPRPTTPNRPSSRPPTSPSPAPHHGDVPPAPGTSEGRVDPPHPRQPAPTTVAQPHPAVDSHPHLDIDMASIPMNPNPVSGPTVPVPATSDAQRKVLVGERVLYQGKEFLVAQLNTDGSFNIKDDYSRHVVQVNRRDFAILRGCVNTICAKDSVIDLQSKQFVAVQALTFDGEFFTMSIDGEQTVGGPVPGSQLAATKGCVTNSTGPVCVGNIGTASNRAVYKVVGIQGNGKIVVTDETDPTTLYTNVDPNSIIPSR